MDEVEARKSSKPEPLALVAAACATWKLDRTKPISREVSIDVI